MSQRHFLEVSDLGRDELLSVLDRADVIREQMVSGRITDEALLHRRLVAFITTKQSLRTGASIAQAAAFWGGGAETFSGNSLVDETGKTREPIADITRCLEEQLYPVIFARLGGHDQLLAMKNAAKRASVVNALTDASHPLQALADVSAFRSARPSVERPKIVFTGDGNNVAVSQAEAVVTMGWDFVHSGPEERRIKADRWATIQELAHRFGGSASYEIDPQRAVEGADMLYADVFASMGQKYDAARLKALLGAYKITENLLRRAKPKAVVGHCLPEGGDEIEPEVLRGPQSIAFEIAGRRMDTTAAIMEMLLRSPR